MKKLIITLSLFALPAFAHVEPNDLITSISVGSAFKTIVDVNIKPNTKSLKLGALLDQATCTLHLQEMVNYDRVIKKDKMLVISKVEKLYASMSGTPRVVFSISTAGITSIECVGKEAQGLKVSDLSDIIQSKLTIVHREPVEI